MKTKNLLSKVPMVKELAKKADIPKVQASFIYDVYHDILVNKIKEGNDVIFPNVGTLRQVKGREMRSNLTGVTIPPHKRLYFKVNISLARFIRVSTREYPVR
jgi:nucleoid DNA-binding protein